MLRVIQAVLLLAFLGAVGAFAIQNSDNITLQFLNYRLTTSLALAIVAVYVLGMLSGWTVVAFLRRSIRRVSEYEEARPR